jgi:acetyl esterase/lipase
VSSKLVSGSICADPFLSLGLHGPNHQALASDTRMKGVWIQPVSHLVFGQIKEWADNADVSAICIPGYWLSKSDSCVSADTPASVGETVIMKLHGGSYIANSAHPEDPTANTIKGILEYANSIKRAFSVEYRLSAGRPFQPANPFPTALLDALAAYNHLVNVLGFDPANIMMEGDSAGGNLALALTKYLVENRDALAKAALPGTKPLTPPGGIILCSPWADLGRSHDQPVQPYLARTDFVGNDCGPRSNYAQTAFLGPLDLSAADSNAYISPASKAIERVSFKSWPRTLIICGGAEYFAPGIRTLKECMSADMGEGHGFGQVSYCEMPDAIHNFLVFTWHEPERSQALKVIAEWVDQHL